MSPEKVEGSESASIRIGYFKVSGESLFLFACLICAFTIRFLLIPQNSVINGDGAYYTLLGEKFASGDLSGGISAYWSPFYSILTGISSLLFHDRDFSGRFVSLVAGSLLIFPTYFFIRECFGRLSAYFGTILVVFHPFLIRSSGWVMTESVYTLIFTLFVLSGWRALSKGGSRAFLTTGLLLGAAFLIKPEAIGYLTLMLGLVIGSKLCCSNISWRRCGANYLFLLLGFAFLFLPYFFFLHNKTGQWTVSQKITVNLPAADFDGKFLGLSGDRRITMKDRIWGDDYETEYRTSTTPRTTNGRSFDSARFRSDIAILGSKTLTLLKKQVRDYLPTILPYPFIVLLFAGFFCRPWTRARAAREIYVFSLVMSTLIGYAASTIEMRYLFPLTPILIAWAANGITEFGDWAVRSIRRIFGIARKLNPLFVDVLILILLLGSLTPLFVSVFKTEDIVDVPFEEKAAGLWIKDHATRSIPVVMSSHITAAYYAGAKHLYLPDEELSTIIEYAKLRKVDYVVFSERRMRDEPEIFGEENGVPQDLKLVYRDASEPNFEVLVYQLSY